jgi:hypothetical protein
MISLRYVYVRGFHDGEYQAFSTLEFDALQFGSTVFFFLNSHSGGVESKWFHSARRPLNGLLYLPRVIMMMENLVE